MRMHVPFMHSSIGRNSLLPTLFLLIGFLFSANGANAQSVAATVNVGFGPAALVVNPATNKIYVGGSANALTVIDGASNSVTSISTAWAPMGIAVNPTTNKIYVANGIDNAGTVTVIDGATNQKTNIASAANAQLNLSIAVNPVTNKIYAVNTSSNNVTVINGADNSYTTVPTGSFPTSIAINTVSNKIYVVNTLDKTITVIDGATNATSTVSFPETANETNGAPISLAVNSVTNKIYVSGQFYGVNSSGNNFADLKVIDGATNAVSTYQVETAPAGSPLVLMQLEGIAINSKTNKAYVIDATDKVIIFDGTANTGSILALGTASNNVARSVAVDEGTNTIYVTNGDSNSITAINGATNATSFVAVGAEPIGMAINTSTHNVYVGNWKGTTVSVIDGANNGAPAATTTSLSSDTNPAQPGAKVTFTAYVTANSGSAIPTGSVTFSVDGANVSTAALDVTGHTTYATASLTAGSHSVVADYTGTTGFTTSASSALTETILPPQAAAPAFSPAANTYTSAQSVTIADATPGAAIYYTLDGTTPTTNSTKYTAAIQVSATETINAIAEASGYTQSVISSATYTISAPTGGSGTITTVAGNGTNGLTGDGSAATSAELSNPWGVAFDSAGNLYIADSYNNRLRKVSSTGVITTFAGSGNSGTGSFSGDGGAATSAKMWYPVGITFDSAGNMYVSENDNNRIRKITPAGIISTFAGNGTQGYNGDGAAATSAALWNPSGIAFDATGNLYIADSGGNRIRKITPAGIISTVAGTGIAGYTGDGGAATSAEIYNPTGIAFDNTGNLYIADGSNSRVRKVSTSGSITTVVGTGVGGYSGDGGPALSAKIWNPTAIAFDAAGNLYIADASNSRVRKVNSTTGTITTVAGTGVGGYSGDGGAATSANIWNPTGLAFDAAGNLYIADGSNNRIRKVSNAGGAAPPTTVNTTTTVSSDTNPASAGAKVTFTATVAASSGPTTPTGSVAFSIDGATVSTVPLDSEGHAAYATATLSSGTHSVTANYAGATGFASSNSSTLTETILQPQAASPIFSPAQGAFQSAQSVTITDTTASAAIYYTADGTTPTASSTRYTGPISVSSTETLEAIAVAEGYSNSAVSTAVYTINIPTGPVPVISNMLPALTSAGGSAFTLTLNGSGFASGSTVYWGASPLTTHYVSATQLTASVTATNIAAAGITAITVQSPASAGGVSNAVQFEVDSAPSNATVPIFSAPTATVVSGATANYAVTLPTAVTSATVTCLNLPVGASCSYSSTGNTVTIATLPTTPKGSYQITVVFSETEPKAAAGFLLLPVLLLPLALARKRLAARGFLTAACIALIVLVAVTFNSGCGGGASAPTTPPPSQTQQITSSAVVSLTVQ